MRATVSSALATGAASCCRGHRRPGKVGVPAMQSVKQGAPHRRRLPAAALTSRWPSASCKVTAAYVGAVLSVASPHSSQALEELDRSGQGDALLGALLCSATEHESVKPWVDLYSLEPRSPRAAPRSPVHAVIGLH